MVLLKAPISLGEGINVKLPDLGSVKLIVVVKGPLAPLPNLSCDTKFWP